MKVGELQSLVRSVQQLTAAAGGNQRVIQELERVSQCFEPFKEQDIGVFADFLAKADVYHREGTIPMGARRKAAPKQINQERVLQTAQQIRSLEERATEPGMSDEVIETEVSNLTNGLNKDEMLELARQVDVTVGAKAGVQVVRDQITSRVKSRRAAPAQPQPAPAL